MQKISDFSKVDINKITTYNLVSGKIFEPQVDLFLKDLKSILIKKALKKYKNISIFEHKSFSILENELIFWFNDENESTRCLIEKVDLTSKVWFRLKPSISTFDLKFNKNFLKVPKIP